MDIDPNALPLRKDGRIDTRPLEIEEWLEGLPYIDFRCTSGLLHAALSASNKVPLKPGIRRELLALYHQPYQYYLDSQIKAGAQHTLQSIDTMQQQLRAMKQLAADLALAARLILEDTINRKSLWGQNKVPLDVLQQAMIYLSHALIFTFLEYAPTPRNVWKQMNLLYKLAEDLDQQRVHVPAPGAGNAQTTIENTYNRIMLIEVVDPHHLPFGAIWEIYEQLEEWIAHTRLRPFEQVDNPAGLFVVDLESDRQPLPYAKFAVKTAGPAHRLLDASELEPVLKRHLEQVRAGSPDNELKLSSYYAGNLLAHMARAWSQPPKRNFPREANSGKVQVVCGMNPVHYHLNHGRDYLREIGTESARPAAEGLDVSGDEYHGIMDATTSNYSLDQWDIVNEGPGGWALAKNSRPSYTLRVGELVGIHHPEQAEERNWSLGAIRWLMTDGRQGYRLGIQLLSRTADPVAVRTIGGGRNDDFRRAFLINNPGEPILITGTGFHTRNRNIELVHDSGRRRLQTAKLLESSVGYEQIKIT